MIIQQLSDVGLEMWAEFVTKEKLAEGRFAKLYLLEDRSLTLFSGELDDKFDSYCESIREE